MSKIERAKELLELIQKYDEAYFTNNESLVTDEEYDNLWYELRDLLSDKDVAKALKKTSMPIGQQKSHLDKIQHLVNVMSLDKLKIDASNFDKKLQTFMNKYDTGEGWVVESKLDGLTIVIYAKGNERVFVTRGGSQKGENVTHVFKQIKHIYDAALQIPDGMIVRGEAIIKVKDFESLINELADDADQFYQSEEFQSVLDRLTDEQKEVVESQDVKELKKLVAELKKNKKNDLEAFELMNEYAEKKSLSFSNPRNLASASVRTKDLNTAQERNVDFVAYDIMNQEKFDLTKETEITDLLQSYGFNTVTREFFKTNDELIQFFEDRDDENRSVNAEKFRNDEEYEIDGLVIKPNLKILNPENDGHHEKGQIAVKYAPICEKSKLLSVEWTEGKNGRLTPVAHFEKVKIGGTTIRKASLGSFGSIKEKDLKIGDEIIVERANDVIPQVREAITSSRDGSEIDIEIPDNAKLVKGLVFLDNYETPLEAQVAKLADSIGIDNSKEATFKKMIEAGYISKLSDLFSLEQYEKELKEIKGLGEKTIDDLLDQISIITPQVTFAQIVNGLFLSNVGKIGAKEYSKLVPTYDDYLQSDFKEIEKELSKISGFSKNQISGLKELYTLYANELKLIYANNLNKNI